MTDKEFLHKWKKIRARGVVSYGIQKGIVWSVILSIFLLITGFVFDGELNSEQLFKILFGWIFVFFISIFDSVRSEIKYKKIVVTLQEKDDSETGKTT